MKMFLKYLKGLIICFVLPFLAVAFFIIIAESINSFIFWKSPIESIMDAVHAFSPIEHQWVRILYVIWFVVSMIVSKYINRIGND
jgi:hypothetical protein